MAFPGAASGGAAPARELRVVKDQAAWLAVWVAGVLTVAKFAVGVAINSLAVLSHAVDSLFDLVSSVVSLVSVRTADQPADRSHPFGHGKFEALAALFQAILIAATGGWIVYAAIARLRGGAVLGDVNLGLGVMGGSLAVSFLVARRLRQAARRTDSLSLEANAIHFSMDVYSYLGVIIGLALVKWTGWVVWDSVVAMTVVAIILGFVGQLVWRALADLVDASLPEAVQQQVIGVIEDVVARQRPRLHAYRRLRTRRSGSQRMIDFYLVAARSLRFDEAHRLADALEAELRQRVSNADVIIHAEPCEPPCAACDGGTR